MRIAGVIGHFLQSQEDFKARDIQVAIVVEIEATTPDYLLHKCSFHHL